MALIFHFSCRCALFPVWQLTTRHSKKRKKYLSLPPTKTVAKNTERAQKKPRSYKKNHSGHEKHLSSFKKYSLLGAKNTAGRKKNRRCKKNHPGEKKPAGAKNTFPGAKNTEPNTRNLNRSNAKHERQRVYVCQCLSMCVNVCQCVLGWNVHEPMVLFNQSQCSSFFGNCGQVPNEGSRGGTLKFQGDSPELSDGGAWPVCPAAMFVKFLA